jgi:phage terminase Nu1 subunit (DNA packaging protein)
MATQEEIARHLDLSDRSIRDLQKQPGAPVKRGRGDYDLEAWTHFYIRFLRAQKGVRDGGLFPEVEGDEDSDEETRRLKLREQQLKIEEREERIAGQRAKRLVFERQYAPIYLITHAVVSVASSINARLEALVPRLKQACPDLSAEGIAALQKELIAASNELANIEPDFSDYADSSEESGGSGSIDAEEENSS